VTVNLDEFPGRVTLALLAYEHCVLPWCSGPRMTGSEFCAYCRTAIRDVEGAAIYTLTHAEQAAA
jgi:hypothetical protein